MQLWKTGQGQRLMQQWGALVLGQAASRRMGPVNAARWRWSPVAQVDARAVWGEELLVVHGGIGEDKHALRCAS